MGSVPICLRIPKSVYKKLEKIKEKKGRLNVQEIIREAISEYLEKEDLENIFSEGVEI